MRPVTIRISGVGSTAPVLLDTSTAPFQVSIGARVVSGSVSYTLQYTYDDPLQSGGIQNWANSPAMIARTGNYDTVLNAGPVTAIRIVNAGNGVVVARVVQAGLSIGTASATPARSYTAGRMMEDALRRAGVAPDKFSSEMAEVAYDQLNLMFNEMANLGIQLWARDRIILPVYVNRNAVPTPSDTSVVLTLNQRQTSRPEVINPFSSAGGNAALAFDNDLETECVQTSAGGTIGAMYATPTRITNVGILFGAAGEFVLTFEYSVDGTTWEVAHTTDATITTDYEWLWIDIEGIPAALGWRVSTAGDDPFVAREIYFGNNPNEIPMGAWNLDDWNAMTVKDTPGAPYNWYQQRDLTAPVLYIWPMPNSMCQFYQLIAWRRRYITEVTAFTQTMDVSRRWFEALTASLARRFCRSLVEADMGRYGMLRSEEAESMSLAIGEERDNSPMRYQPGLDVYQV